MYILPNHHDVVHLKYTQYQFLGETIHLLTTEFYQEVSILSLLHQKKNSFGTQSNKKSMPRKKDHRDMIGDPFKRIRKSIFWNPLHRVPIAKYPKKCLWYYWNQFLVTKNACSQNQKWCFSQQNHFWFFGHIKKRVIGPKLQKWAKYLLKTSFGWYLHSYDM